ncbi:MAG: hypothetical protein ACRC3Y_08215 [Romboutsia sp.]|uniref:hypothetical protein n=1 Tax=Romboutsia sp. TaxID=1965302 RepID=UPI003F3ED7DD
MNNMKKQMENLKDDLQKGMKKAEFVLKDTAHDIKDDAKGVIMSMEMKKDDMVEEYERKKFSKELKHQMEQELKQK